MQKWEYLTTFLRADATTVRSSEYLEKGWPKRQTAKYAPEALIPALNDFGENGWELVHMEPVAGVGKNADVYFTGAAYQWSNAYFCVFKRRKGESGQRQTVFIDSRSGKGGTRV
jgi:hypothetical protein